MAGVSHLFKVTPALRQQYLPWSAWSGPSSHPWLLSTRPSAGCPVRQAAAWGVQLSTCVSPSPLPTADAVLDSSSQATCCTQVSSLDSYPGNWTQDGRGPVPLLSGLLSGPAASCWGRVGCVVGTMAMPVPCAEHRLVAPAHSLPVTLFKNLGIPLLIRCSVLIH